ncbi:tRNA (adenosine(37)-N6)-threonylcarbamoyltransferase complex ATPase subunit type 1 TsaE [Methylophilus sp. QUAN]|uniref:tRNA (adenosine(37)-N6)-threonylcarbamoyltransferase complex ATPase subunit type 1 TsaE n=1 Tax=Methylophilus sp. QUAN TaxID=2781020 RepID=UPI00189049C6|nr:tRNA (adenosine(37)-N6)-threonylcarbamoyltransferase complex ATPase subunit type 1 TsaE [Methylophilus sp. QUAN]MBF4990866.1 tRNA (adenosine(37)-N6)-threonylcarbamoyltransferase complex ATPase subunit type 1 TsaE [Methylophilus sp. QUAN]
MTETYSTQILKDEAATVHAAGVLATQLKPGQVIYLHGDLGAGKTTLVRGILHALGHIGKVKSPTYTIVEPYNLAIASCYHFDLYRFQDPEEWEAAGFRDYFNADSICLVEWPERAEQVLPQADIEILFDILPHGRVLHISSQQPLALEGLCQ